MMAELLEQAICKAGFDFAVKIKTLNSSRLNDYIDQFFEKTTKLTSEFENTVIQIDRDLQNHFAFDGVEMQRLDKNKSKYKIIIDPTLDTEETKNANPILKNLQFGPNQNSLKPEFSIFEQRPLQIL